MAEITDRLREAVSLLASLVPELDDLHAHIEKADKDRSEALSMLDEVGKLKAEIARVEAENNSWREEASRLQKLHEHCGTQILTEQKRADAAEKKLARKQ